DFEVVPRRLIRPWPDGAVPPRIEALPNAGRTSRMPGENDDERPRLPARRSSARHCPHVRIVEAGRFRSRVGAAGDHRRGTCGLAPLGGGSRDLRRGDDARHATGASAFTAPTERTVTPT